MSRPNPTFNLRAQQLINILVIIALLLSAIPLPAQAKAAARPPSQVEETPTVVATDITPPPDAATPSPAGTSESQLSAADPAPPEATATLDGTTAVTPPPPPATAALTVTALAEPTPTSSLAPAPAITPAPIVQTTSSTPTIYLPLIVGGCGDSCAPTDPLAPQIEILTPWGYIQETQPTITALITDTAAAGIDAAGIAVTLDQVSLPSSYAAGSGHLTATLAAPLSLGLHTLVVRVADRANHSKTKTWQFEVVDPAIAAVVTLDPNHETTLTTVDERVTLVVPAEAITQPVKIKGVGYPQLTVAELAAGKTPPPGIPFYLFTLDAWPQGDPAEAPHFQFQQPVTLTAAYLITETKNRVDEDLTLIVRDEISQTWTNLTSAVDLINQTVTAQTDHFSTYGLTGPDDGILSPSLDGFDVGLFSGGAIYSTELQLPAGAGGLTPRLTLTYDGTAPNGMYGPNGEGSGWVGIGWSLNLGSINKERLTLNGVSEELVRDGDSNRYHTKHETFFKIESHVNGDGAGHWLVTDKGGTQYYFGSEGSLGANLYYWQPGLTCEKKERDYKLYRVVDPHGNTIEIEYDVIKAGRATCSGIDGVKEAYPREIRYGLNPAAGDNHAEYRVRLQTVVKDPAIHAGSRIAETGRLLDRVRIEYVPMPGGGSQLIREYRFSYYQQFSGWSLIRLEPIGSDGVTPLPALTFDYTRRYIGYRYRGLHLTERWERPFLGRITSDYGARIEYDYQSESYSGHELRQLVSGRTVTEMVMGLKAQYRYSYAEPAFEKEDGKDDKNQLLGFARVTVTDPAGKVSRHWFYTDEIKRGREYRRQDEDGQGRVYRRVDQSYTDSTAGLPKDVHFLYLAEVKNYTCDGVASGDDTNGCRQTRTVYHYDPAQQGGRQYGNVTRVDEYGAGSLLRYNTTTYYPNPDRWLVNLPAEEKLYSPDNSLLRHTQKYYDGAGSLTTPPGRGDLTRSRAWLGGDAWAVTSSSYDERGNPLVVTGPNGHSTTTGYDSLHHLLPTSVRNPLGHTSYTTYDFRFQRPLNQTDPNGATTSYEYDLFGRLTKVIRPGDSSADPTAAYSYYDPPDPGYAPALRQVDYGGPEGRGLVQLIELYDGLYRPLQRREQVTPAGQQAVTDIFYDQRGLKVKESAPYLAAYQPGWSGLQPDQPATRHSYDLLGRLTQVTAPDGSQSQTQYDRWQTTLIDANGQRRRTTNDALGRLVTVEEFNGDQLYATTHYSYNAAGDLLRVTDAAGHVTQISYDPAGRKVEMDDPDMGRWRYEYDPAGNLLRQVDANGQIIGFAYDALNRLVTRDYGADGSVEISYTYDSGPNGLGRRTRLDDPAGYATWRYDSRGRVSRSERYVTNTRVYGLSYEYDKLDRQVALTYPDGERVETGYNPRGQADTLTSALGDSLVAGSSFNPLGQLTGQTYGNGITAGYSYYSPQTGNNRLERLQLAGPGGESLLNLAYTYDRVGNLTQLVDAAPGLGGPQTQRFEYDFLDRLTLAQSSGGVAGGYDQRFSYDQIGNLIQRTVNGQSQNYSYADPEHVHAATSLDANEYAYDANGNMVWRREAGLDYTQEFDPENRLVKVTAADGVTTTVTRFVYDGDGVRLARITGEGSTVYIGGVFEEFFRAGGPLGLASQEAAPAATGLAAAESRPLPNFPQPVAAIQAEAVTPADQAPSAAGRGLAAPLLQPGETDFLIYAGSGQAQWSPSVAYNPARNEYLVAFVHNNGSGSHAANIYAYRLNQSGDVVGSLIAVSTANDFQLDPYVTFNSDANEYLVVWSDNRSGNTGGGVFRPDIYAQRIRASDGQLVGGNFALTTHASSSQSRPRAAYDPTSQRYLVVWQDGRTGTWQIYGQRLDSNAAAMGGIFQINASSNAQEFPDVAAGSGRFLVAWQELVSGNYEIYARRYNGLSGSGTRQTIASGAASQQHPRAAYNRDADSFLIGWDEGGNVWVRRTDTEGLPTAAALYLTNTASVTEDFNSLSYCSATGAYLVAWQRNGASRPLQAQQVSGLADQGDGGGQTIGAIRTIAATVADTQKAVHLANCQNSGWLLAVWEDWRGSDQDIYGRLVDIAPPPVPTMTAEPAWTAGLSNSVSWTAVTDGGIGGVEYQVQRATDSAFTSGVVNSGWSTNRSYTFSGLVNDQRYYYRVQARDSVLNTSAWSAAVNSSQDATAPQISQPNAAPRTISPNGDGAFDSTTITAVITESHLAGWTMAIARSGTTYRSLSGSGNSINVAWDGRDNGGAAAPDGDYSVAITATDLAGNQRTVTELALVQIDRTPPVLNVSDLSPVQDGQTVSSSQATLRLYADDLRLATVTVNGQPATPVSDKIYQAVVGPLAAGPNLIIVQATDAVNNRSQLNLTVTYDPDGPAIANWRPTGAITTTRPTIAADFEDGISPNILTQTVTLDGQNLPATPTGFSFTPADELAQGEHTVYVRLVDAAGSEGSAAWSFVVDTGTELTVNRPLPGELVSVGLVRVSGQAEAGATVSLWLNGQPVDETIADGTFALQGLELTPGLNTLEVRAVDLLGNIAVESRTITFDSSRPAAMVWAEPTVFSPNGDGQRDETTFWLTAAPPLFSDLAGWRLTIVSGSSVITQASGGALLPPSLSWDGRQLSGDLAPDGLYDYTLTVTATNGQVTTTPAQVVRLDTVPPAAPVITSPADPLTYTPAAMLRIAGTAEPNLLVTVQSGVFTQVVQAGDDGSWELIFPLQNGLNELVAVATDRAGQVSPPSAGKLVVVTVEPPLYTVGVEPDLAGQGATVILEATARHIKPAEGLPTRWLTATVPTGDLIGLTRITTEAVPTGSWRSSWPLPVADAVDGERVVSFRGEDEGGQVGYGETALVIDTLPPETPWLSQPRGEVWVGEPEVLVSGQAIRLGQLQVYLDGETGVSSPVDANGEWRVSQPLPGAEHRLRARVTDLAGNLSGWSNEAVVKVDLIAPTTSLTVPAVAGGSFTVQWSGDDGGGSGIVAYELEYQDNGGPWQAWLAASVTETTARFSGEPHHTYTIRARAWDRVGHAGEWVSGAVEVAAVTKYYLLDGRRVAMRQGDVVYYLHGDHLGSTTLTTDQTGAVVAEQRYLPYGELRWTGGALPTDFTFTGQRSEAFGLLDYNARYYDPLLGRFVSADTVVPDPKNPQDWNRYTYAANNPLKYVDPDGHCQGLAGAAWTICAQMAMAVAPAVHKANEYREDIFFPDANTTFADRLEASTVVGGGAVLAAAAGVEAAGVALGGGPLTTAALGNTAATATGGASATTACADGDCTNEVQAATRAFWSGGDVAKEAAQSWAKANNGITLEMTEAGQRVEKITEGLKWSEAIQHWVSASQDFAAEAVGEVHVFQNSASVSLESVWRTTEYPMLLRNPNVTRIIYHAIMPNGSDIIVP